ncbi:nucleoside triphosphate pyrophosphohydrolase family protein [Bacillus cereus]|uniref:nucleoside triphosphate pyrophosphohydrolase family protein n=1 Tax=Bacillus cereus TaxID=1396 RepID=UPI0011A8FDEB|nr:nucleoside triphosphate pyrophosphohydrolase family protein [Bacillus cereus]
MEIKEGTLISYRSVLGYIALGVVDKVVDDYKVWAYWSDERDNNTSWIDKHDILEAWEVINFEEEAKMTKKTDELKIGFDWEPKESKPKKLLPTKPYGQLISYISWVDGREKWGLYTHTEGLNLHGYWGRWGSEEEAKGFIIKDMLHRVVDVIVHEPKEQNLSAAQELSVQQETNNFAHAAVQGIVNAHAIKELEDSHKSRLKQMGVTPKPCSPEVKTYDDGFKDGYKKATDVYLEEELDKLFSPVFTFSDFDLSVSRTWKKQDFKDAVSNAALGLTGEAGEVADLIKKGIYHGRGFHNVEDGDPEFSGMVYEQDLMDELSDVLFYVSAMAQEFGFTLEDIAKHNREKLEKRFPEGFSTEASAQKKDRAPEVKPKEVTD